MATHTPKPVIHIYKEINVGMCKTVKHYELQNNPSIKTELSKTINVSKDRQCTKSSPLYWLKVHNGKKWVKPRLTGVFKTIYKDFYKGDTINRRNLIIFKFLENIDNLTVYYFQNYYTKDLSKSISQIPNQ